MIPDHDNQNGEGDSGYVGKCLHNLDQHLRVKLPTKWRQPGWPHRFMILPWPIDPSDRLLVMTPSRWARLMAKFRELPLSDEDAAAVETVICAEVTEAVLDSSGRLTLPTEAAQAVGIDRQVRLIGRGDKFEVWEPARWEATLRACKSVAAGKIKKLSI